MKFISSPCFLNIGYKAVSYTHLDVYKRQEQAALAALGVNPVMLVDPASPVTTPYDMLINQIVEQARGDGRHGSCGVGFGETIERNLTPPYALTVGDLANPGLADRLDAIRRDYAPARLTRLGYGAAYLENADLFQSDAVLAHFVEDVGRFRGAAKVAQPLSLIHI